MKNNGFKKDLLVNLEDKDMSKVSSEFLRDIEKGFTDFKAELQKHEKELEKYLNSSTYIFEPEKISKRSPLTIINAPWGTGKTYFIENLLKLMFDNKIESKVFKKFIIIDAWKFSNSKDVPLEFSIELSKKLIKSQLDDQPEEVKAEITKRFLKKIIPASINWQINAGVFSFGATHDTKAIKEEVDLMANQSWEKIASNKIPTLIFVDNLERLGNLSWDLLKAILKLQEFENYLIVLPLNLNKLKNNEITEKNTEYPINKYVDFMYFNFKQDYSNYFKAHFSNEKVLKSLNDIFNIEINGEKLSIREVENAFKTNNLYSVQNYYKLLSLTKNIWNPKSVYVDLLSDEVLDFIEHEKLKFEKYIEVSDILLIKDSDGSFLNIPKTIKDENIKVIVPSTNQIYYFKLNHTYESEYETVVKAVNAKISEIELDIKSVREEIQKLSTDKNKTLTEINKLSQKLEKEMVNETQWANMREDYDGKKHELSKNAISNYQLKISQFKTEVEDFNSNIAALSEKVLKLNSHKDQTLENQKKLADLIIEWRALLDEQPLDNDSWDAIYKAIDLVKNDFAKNFHDLNGEYESQISEDEMTKIINNLLDC